MQKNNPRIHRISQAIQIELVKLIEREIKDPRLGIVTVTGVEVTSDLSYAKIYIVARDESKAKESLKILNGAASFLRRRLAKEVRLRVIPELQFHYDQASIYGSKMYALLKNVQINNDDEE